MPSYYLSSEMNLGDLEDRVKSRANLYLGELQGMYADDVTFTGGSMKVSELRIKGTSAVSEVLHVNSVGGLSFTNETILSKWPYTLSVIPMSGFSNTSVYTPRSSLCNVALNGRWDSLINLPVIDTLLSVSFDRTKLYTKSNNLSEFGSSLILDTRNNRQTTFNTTVSPVFGTPLLSNLVYEPAEMCRIQGVLIDESFSYQSPTDQPNVPDTNSLLYSERLMDADPVSDHLPQRNTVYWKNPINDSEGNPLPNMTLIQNFFSFISRTNDQSSVTMQNMRTFSNTIVSSINTLETSLDIVEVERIMRERIETDVMYLSSNLFLSEFDDDSKRQACRSNLGIQDIATQDTSMVTATNLRVLQNLKLSSVTQPGIYIALDSNQDMVTDRILGPTDTDLGLVQIFISDDLLDTTLTPETHSFMVPHRSVYIEVQQYISDSISSSEATLQRIVDQLVPSNRQVLATTTLSGYALYSQQELMNVGVYTNLNLSPLTYTGDYQYLTMKPIDNAFLFNDIGAMLIELCFGGVDAMDNTQAQANLGMASMCTQNEDAVNMKGSSITADTVIVKSNVKITPPEYVSVERYMVGASNNTGGSAHLVPMTLANDQAYGGVYISNTFSADTPNSVITGDTLTALRTHIHGLMDALEVKLVALEAARA